MRSRTATALIGLLASAAISVVVWRITGSVVAFLFVPFLALLFRRGRDDGPEGETVASRRHCPKCGLRTAERDYEYCPRDGTRLRTEPATESAHDS